MQDKLQQIRDRVTKGSSGDSGITTSLFYLIKELKCLPEIIGREYKVSYDNKGRISRIRQIPMKISSLMVLFKELEEDNKRQEREMKNSKHSGRRR